MSKLLALLIFLSSVTLINALSMAPFNINDTNISSVTTVFIVPSPIEGVLSPNGNLLYVDSYDTKNVTIIDTSTNTVVNTIALGGNNPFNSPRLRPDGLVFTPSGREILVTCGACNSVYVIDVASNTISTIIRGLGSTYGISIQPSGKLAFISESVYKVAVLNVSTNTIINTINVAGNPYYSGVSPSGNLVYVPTRIQGIGINEGNVSVIDVAANAVVSTMAVGSNPYQAAFTPSGKEAYVTNHDDNTVSVIDVSSNTVVNTIAIGDAHNCTRMGCASKVSFSPSGSLAYIADHSNGNVVVVDVATNTVLYNIFIGTGNPRDIALSPSGATAYSAGGDGVHVINTLQLTENQTSAISTTSITSSTSSFTITITQKTTQSSTTTFSTTVSSPTTTISGTSSHATDVTGWLVHLWNSFFGWFSAL